MFLKYPKVNHFKTMPLFNKAFNKNILALTSDRTVDFTFLNDQDTLNQTQKDFLAVQFRFNSIKPVSIHQVHGNKVLVADKISYNTGDPHDADGLITQVPDLPLAIRSADCLPVFIYDPKHNGIGLIHVGWKGSYKNIVGETIKAIKKQWQGNPKDLKIAFGPAIRACCYEVGSEFQEFFPNSLIVREYQYYLDLPQVVHGQLLAYGVSEGNISDCSICTCCDPDYFSFRRDKEHAGRMISLMMIKKPRD